MSESLSMLVSTWRNEAFAKHPNEIASKHLDTINFSKIRDELNWYLYGLILDEGPSVIQAKRAQGPEDLPLLLMAVQKLAKNKARIAAIGLDMATYQQQADQLFDVVKKTLAIKPEFGEIKASDKDTVARLVARELMEFKDAADSIVAMAKVVAKEYNDAFNAVDLEFKILNTMCYTRGLYPQQQQGNNGPKIY